MKRKTLWWMAGTAAGLCLAGGVIASGVLVKPYLEYKIRGSGFPKANIETVRVIPFGLLLENVSLDPDGFSTIEAVQVKGSWFDILARQTVDNITVKNVEISGELDDQGHLIIAGWDASPLTGGSGGGLTISNLNVEGLTLDFETPEGAIRTEGKVSLQQKPTGERHFQASLWGKQKQMSLTVTATGVIQTSGAWNSEIEINDGRVDISAFKASRASGKFTVSGGGESPLTYQGKVLAGGLRLQDIPFQDTTITVDSAKPELLAFQTNPTGYADIVLNGRIVDVKAPRIEASVSVKDVTDLARLFELKTADLTWLEKADPLAVKLAVPFAAFSEPQIAATWDATIGASAVPVSGTASLNREAHTLSGTLAAVKIDGATLSGLLPLDKEFDLAFTSGSVSGVGAFSYDYEAEPLTVGGNFSVQADKLGGTWKDYPLENISGTVALSQLVPWKIDKPQTVTIKTIATGVNLSDGSIQFSGSQTGGYKVSKAGFTFGGGKLSVTPFTWKTQAKTNTVTVNLENIDLAELANSVEAKGVIAQGRLSGTIPVVFGKDGLTFKNGVVTSTGEGMFQYTPATYPAALQGDDTRMETVRRALSDFRYSALEVSVGGNLDGALTTHLKATGKNPVFGDRPINLNINLEGALIPALQQALQPEKFADKIRQSINGDKQ